MTGSTKLPTSEWVEHALSKEVVGDTIRQMIPHLTQAYSDRIANLTESRKHCNSLRLIINEFEQSLSVPPDDLTMDSPLASLMLKERVLAKLSSVGILRIGDLVDWPPHELMCVSDVGRRTVDYINKKLSDAGLTFWHRMMIPSRIPKRKR